MQASLALSRNLSIPIYPDLDYYMAFIIFQWFVHE